MTTILTALISRLVQQTRLDLLHLDEQISRVAVAPGDFAVFLPARQIVLLFAVAIFDKRFQTSLIVRLQDVRQSSPATAADLRIAAIKPPMRIDSAIR